MRAVSGNSHRSKHGGSVSAGPSGSDDEVRADAQLSSRRVCACVCELMPCVCARACELAPSVCV